MGMHGNTMRELSAHELDMVGGGLGVSVGVSGLGGLLGSIGKTVGGIVSGLGSLIGSIGGLLGGIKL